MLTAIPYGPSQKQTIYVEFSFIKIKKHIDINIIFTIRFKAIEKNNEFRNKEVISEFHKWDYNHLSLVSISTFCHVIIEYI